MTVPSTLADIRQKVRRITGRPSAQQITDVQIDQYINTFYIYDLPEHLQLISNRVNYQFLTTANRAVYDLPTDLYLTALPPVYIGSYQSFMTQSREAFFRLNPGINLMIQSVAVGTGLAGPYTFTLPNIPIRRGWKPNPPGAYSLSTVSDIAARFLNWQVLISGTDANGDSVSLVDDGQGNLFSVDDLSTDPALFRGTINYITGAVVINDPTVFATPYAFTSPIAVGAPINAQYVPYKASRPQSVVFFQDQFSIFPIPDQAYTVSFEAYKVPTVLLQATDDPQLKQWWQCLAYGAADKIFTDNADMENAAKFRPLLDEQLRLIQRRTIVQQTSERTATIYTEQNAQGQYPFGNLFGGM
jgi:hypothetical protein